MEIRVPDGSEIDDRHTAYGAGLSPPITFVDVPEEAVTLAVFIEHVTDPDRSRVHWVIWNIPAGTDLPEGIPSTENPEMVPGAVQGNNTFSVLGYTPPQKYPDQVQTYRITAYALDTRLSLSAGDEAEQVRDAMKHGVVAKATRELGFSP